MYVLWYRIAVETKGTTGPRTVGLFGATASLTGPGAGPLMQGTVKVCRCQMDDLRPLALFLAGWGAIFGLGGAGEREMGWRASCVATYLGK